MYARRLVQIGGVINWLFVIFHLSFWKLFGWPQSIALWSPVNRTVVQVLNIHAAYVLAVFGFLSFAFRDEMSTTRMGRSVGMAIAVFWVLRGVNQLVFEDISSGESWAITAVCLGVAALYVIPSMSPKKKVFYPLQAANES